MVEMSFLQIGHMPRCKGKPGPYPLRSGEWRLNGLRSVAYLQTKEQKEDRFLSLQRRELGFPEARAWEVKSRLLRTPSA
jgi:hypothetical protein